MATTAKEIYQISTSEVRVCSVDMRAVLDEGELLSGTPVVSEDDALGLLFSSEQISSVALVINGKTVPIGEAIRFTADASSATTGDSTVSIVVDTTGGQTVHARVCLEVID